MDSGLSGSYKLIWSKRDLDSMRGPASSTKEVNDVLIGSCQEGSLT